MRYAHRLPSRWVCVAVLGAGLVVAGVVAAPASSPRRTDCHHDLPSAETVLCPRPASEPAIALCQAFAPLPTGDIAAQPPMYGAELHSAELHGAACPPGGGAVPGEAWGPIPWQALSHGEYVGPPRLPHLPEYHLRVDDEIEFVYVLTREELQRPYQLEVGDVIRIESIIDPNLNREVTVQPDGSIDLLLLGPLRVARRTVEQVRDELHERYKKYYKVTDLNVTRVKTQTRLEDLRAAVDSRFYSGGQGKRVRVTPEGTISLPLVGVVPAQGLTLAEIKREVDERYRHVVTGLEVTPILAQRAPRFIYVVGEVRAPGRYDLVGPTTVIQSIALAGGWNNGGNLREVVVFRRGDDWRLLATKLNLSGALHGKQPIPADEIWLRDSDVVVVPKSGLLRADDVIELVFTRGIYSVFPVGFWYQLNQATVIPVP